MTIILRNITKTYLTEEGQRLVFKNTGCTLPSGKNIAIMGDNGSGKSTFLRLVGQATYPDKGKIITDERISWPVGFRGCLQMSLTPKENIVFVCMLMQRDKIQTKKIIDFVEDFSEMGEYFNLPIKKFSTGMRARLAFSISMAFDFDCYLIDEVTNTGDTNFKVKAQEALLKKSETGRLIIVSHALKNLKKFCNMGVIVNNHKIYLYDNLNHAVEKYTNKLANFGHDIKLTEQEIDEELSKGKIN